MSSSTQENSLSAALTSPIARKLLSEIAILIVMLMLIISAAAVFTQVKQEFEKRNESVRFAINSLDDILIESIWNLEYDDISAALNSLEDNDYIKQALLWDEDGAQWNGTDSFVEIFAADFGLSFEELESGLQSKGPNIQTYASGIDAFRGYWVPLRFSTASQRVGSVTDSLGTLLIISEDRQVWNEVRSLAFTFVTMAALGLALLCLVLMLLIARRVVDPINRLARSLDEIRPSEDEVGVLIPDWSRELKHEMQEREDEISVLFSRFAEFREALLDRDQRLLRYQRELESRVEERTSNLQSANRELASALSKLQVTQEDLIESEKMASLGGLVSGVAHEVNTPLGVSVTAASHLQEEVDQIEELVSGGNLSKTDFQTFLNASKDSTTIILSNLRRAADLIHSFKQVAVDQSSEEIREINLVDYCNEVLRSLHPKLKRTSINVIVRSEKAPVLRTFPGALAQIITNLVMNAVIHAFKNGEQPGEIHIDLEKQGDTVRMVFSDNGVGIEPQTRDKIFEPFFTTRRGQGGSGLGLNIVYNIVIRQLGGRIRCESELGHYTQFIIEFSSASAGETL